MAATLHVYEMKSALELPLNVISVNIDFVISNSTTDVDTEANVGQQNSV